MNNSTVKKTSTGQELAVVDNEYRQNKISKVSTKELKELGEMFFQAGAFGDIKNAAQAMIKILAGNELGFTPIQSMAGIHFFQGKVVIGANLIASLIKDSGRYNYDVLEHSNTKCAVQFVQKRDDKWVSMGVPVVYTIEDAKNANLMGNPAWKNHPADMLFASCIRKGSRRYTPDVLRGATAESDGQAESFLDAVDVQQAQVSPQVAAETEEVETVEADLVRDEEPAPQPPDDTVIDAEPVHEDEPAERDPESRIVDLQLAIKDEINRLTGGESRKVQELLNGRVVAQMSEKALITFLGELQSK